VNLRPYRGFNLGAGYLELCSTESAVCSIEPAFRWPILHKLSGLHTNVAKKKPKKLLVVTEPNRWVLSKFVNLA